MCIFCGGACGGAGDVMLPAITAAVPLITLKIQAKLAAHKGCDQEKTDSDKADDLTGNTANTATFHT